MATPSNRVDTLTILYKSIVDWQDSQLSKADDLIRQLRDELSAGSDREAENLAEISRLGTQVATLQGELAREREARELAEAKCAEMLIAVRLNHAWYLKNNKYERYEDSQLCEVNTHALGLLVGQPLLAARERLEKRNKLLENIFQIYADHDPSCPTRKYETSECDCGFNEAFTACPPPELKEGKDGAK